VLQVLGEAIAARRLRTAEVLAQANAAEMASEERSLTRQIIDKMKSFFGIGTPLPELPISRIGTSAPAFTN
jgi:hypothetical protein